MTARPIRRRTSPGEGSRRARREWAPPVVLLLALGMGWTPVGFGAPLPTACGFTVGVVPSPATGPAPLLVHFNASVSSGSPSEFDWNFGDGSFWNSSVAGASSPLHRYTNPGEYSATVTATESGCSVAAAATVAASPATLRLNITASPASGTAPLTVEFAANVTGGTGTYVSALWTFGDGSVGSGIPVAYTYQRSGTFTYRVNVTDSDGHWAVASGTEVVRPGLGSGSGDILGVSPGALLLAVLFAVAVLAGAALFFVGRRLGRGRQAVPETPDADSGAPAAGPSAMPGSVGPRRAVEGADGREGTGPSLSEAPREPAPTVLPTTPRPPGRARVQLTQRVVLHIGSQGRVGPDEVGHYALTQAGMAAALGVGQNTITNVLRRLVAAGVLVQEVRHVSGQTRRLRVYRFTPRGESVYRDVRLRRGAGSGVERATGEEGAADDRGP